MKIKNYLPKLLAIGISTLAALTVSGCISIF